MAGSRPHRDRAARRPGQPAGVPLYRDGKSIWRQGLDTAAEIEVAVIEIERDVRPPEAVYRWFTPKHLPERFDQVEVGTPDRQLDETLRLNCAWYADILLTLTEA